MLNHVPRALIKLSHCALQAADADMHRELDQTCPCRKSLGRKPMLKRSPFVLTERLLVLLVAPLQISMVIQCCSPSVTMRLPIISSGCLDLAPYSPHDPCCKCSHVLVETRPLAPIHPAPVHTGSRGHECHPLLFVHRLPCMELVGDACKRGSKTAEALTARS